MLVEHYMWWLDTATVDLDVCRLWKEGWSCGRHAARTVDRADVAHKSAASYCRRVVQKEPTPTWVVREVQDVSAMGRGQLKRVSVDLPDGTAFDQFVLDLPTAVIVAALRGTSEVLMIRRFRFVVDRWLWELPGGYVEEGEDLVAAARRELEEETGWTAGSVEHLVTFEPMVGTASAPNLVYVARGCVRTDALIDVNEASEVRWISLEEAASLVASGEIVGAASVVAIAQLLATTNN